MEALMRSGFITASLDITTTELADDLVGGVLSAGPDRLEAAGELGIPQVVSLGALDMVNFRPIARKLNAARGPVTLYVPLRGVSLIATEGQPFHDTAADEALFGALRNTL